MNDKMLVADKTNTGFKLWFILKNLFIRYENILHFYFIIYFFNSFLLKILMGNGKGALMKQVMGFPAWREMVLIMF